MSETAVTPTEKKPEFKSTLEALTVKRNDVELLHVGNVITRGDDKGWEYLAPAVTEENLDTVIAWCGRKIVVKRLNGFLRQMGQGWWENASEEATSKETKQVDLAKAYEVYAKLAEDFSARGESIPELQAQIAELVEQITELDPTEPEQAIRFKEMAQEIKQLKLDISLQRRKPRKAKTDGEQQTNTSN